MEDQEFQGHILRGITEPIWIQVKAMIGSEVHALDMGQFRAKLQGAEETFNMMNRSNGNHQARPTYPVARGYAVVDGKGSFRGKCNYCFEYGHKELQCPVRRAAVASNKAKADKKTHF